MTKNIFVKKELNSFCLEEDGKVNHYLNHIKIVLNYIVNIGVIVVNSELIIQILSLLLNNHEVFTNCLMYQIVLMPSFTKLTTMMLQEELCYEIKDIHKV
jgi:hypothetical protein